jgi:carboxylate-amine ligase
MKNYPFYFGVEEEYQIIDQTRDLRSHLSKIVDGAKIILNEQVKSEMHQSVVEVGTIFAIMFMSRKRKLNF